MNLLHYFRYKREQERKLQKEIEQWRALADARKLVIQTHENLIKSLRQRLTESNKECERRGKELVSLKMRLPGNLTKEQTLASKNQQGPERRD